MTPCGRHTAIAAIIMLVITSSAAVAMPPKPGASGLSDSCQRCHVGDAGTSVGASLTIEGVPGTYVPGHMYTVTVVLDRGRGPDPHYAILHAFQLGVTGVRVEVPDASLVAVNDTEVGSRGASNATEWSVVWTAPFTGDDVVFFAEAVVADGDGTEEGDVTLEAKARSYGPLDVPPEDEAGPWAGRLPVIVLVVAVLALVGYTISFTHRRAPPRSEED